MIVRTMSKELLVRELNSDMDFLYGMNDGWKKKYHKQLKNKKIPEMALLATTEYTSPNQNKIVVHLFKTILNKKDYSFYAVPVWKTYFGYITPLINDWGRAIGATEYSSHAVQRIKERLGMDFLEYQKKIQGSLANVEYHFNDCPDETVASLGDFGFGFFKKTDWGKICTTVVSKEQLYDNQIELFEECFKNNEEAKRQTKEFVEVLVKQRRLAA